MRKCKWCDQEIPDSHSDNQCDACWEVVVRLDWVQQTPKLLKHVLEELQKPVVHYCCICHKNIVDAENGFDTCNECLRRR